METRVSVYKRTDEQYMLKLKASRAFFSEVWFETNFSSRMFMSLTHYAAKSNQHFDF